MVQLHHKITGTSEDPAGNQIPPRVSQLRLVVLDHVLNLPTPSRSDPSDDVIP